MQLCTMTSVCPDWDLATTVAGMQRHDYVGLEPRIGWRHAQNIEPDCPPARRTEIRSQLADDGLGIPCIATGVRSAVADPAERVQAVEDMREAIDLAADLGARCVRTFGGAYEAGVELRHVVDRAAACYREVMSQAADRGVDVLFETHDAWCDSAHVRAVVERVDHPNMGVLWDLLHTARRFETPAQSAANLAQYVRHVHVHDARWVDDGRKIEICKFGDGFVDHAGCLAALRRAGYEGFVSVEIIHKPGSAYDADAVLADYAGVL